MVDRWLVVTDLDGTLLNHHDYRADAALPVLQALEQAQIPVIFNTSKTYAEVDSIARKFDNPHPFIVENGSAILIPRHYFDIELLQASFDQVHSSHSHHCITIGSGVNSLLLYLEQTKPDAINLKLCSVEQAMAITGLDESSARAAQARQYSIPLKFDNAENEQAFVAEAAAAGLKTVRGGRFLHLLGDCNKGDSMIILKNLYQRTHAQRFGIVALGDSPNDLDMLQAADKAVIVQSPSSDQLTPTHDHLVRTHKSAPEGWAEGIHATLALDQPNNFQPIQ